MFYRRKQSDSLSADVMSFSRYNAYRIMWVLVFFDLPTETKKQRSVATRFRKSLLDDGFNRVRFSMYLRHCQRREHADMEVNGAKGILPGEQKVGILCITDKQFAQMELFYSKKETDLPPMPVQLELF